MDSDNYYSEHNCNVSLEKIKTLIERVVLRYIDSSVIPAREKEDVVMTIMEKFLKCRQKIDESYEGKSKISTYYVAIFNRMCCEVIRKEQKHWYSVNDLEYELIAKPKDTTVADTENGVVIKDELKRLGAALQVFNGQSAKVNLFAKYYFNIPITEIDLKNYSGKFPGDMLHIIGECPPRNKADIFKNLAKLVGFAEGKQVKGDAVRMWLNKSLDTLLDRINMNGISNHTRETLQILMEIRKS